MNQPAVLPKSPAQPGRAEAFAERVSDIVNLGAVAVMLSIGHRTGLLAAMAGRPAAGSAAIAASAGLAERYVREWLAALVTAGIVEYEPGTATYRLPDEHAACLVPGGALGNLAVYTQHVALMGQMQERIIECFRTGAGTRYEEYPHFHHMMAEDSGQTVVAQLRETILPLVPGLEARLESGIEVLDAGCGRGEALVALGQAFPESRFTGYDLCADAVAAARAAAARAGVDNVRFEVVDMTHFDEPGRYDLVTSFDAVHDQQAPDELIRRIRRALRPDGVYVMQDIGGSAALENNLDFPMAAFLYAISCVHCTPVSLGQGGAGLGTMWGWETAERMLRDAGFRDIQRHLLPHDPQNVWFVSR
ncbi:MAG: methyltransferase domain-containing protein [Pseudomonadales bacterium]|nr:methyltransferase domain-containing protein [Pseudomonadales bacterium]